MQKYIPFFQGEKRSITERLADYFDQSGLETKIHYEEAKDSYILSVPADKENEAKKLYQDFYFNERERVEREENSKDFLQNYDESNILKSDMLLTSEESHSDKPIEDTQLSDNTSLIDDDSVSYEDDLNTSNTTENQEDDDTDQAETQEENNDKDKASLKDLISGSGNYVFKSEKYKDYIGTFYVFLFLGIAGIIFVILNITNVLNVLHGFFPNLVMSALFIFFIYEGIATGRKAKQLKSEIEEENQLTEKINQWLRNTVTEDFLASISNDELSEELDYIKKTDTIRDMLLIEFGDVNTDYLDRLIEEYYSETFETSEINT